MKKRITFTFDESTIQKLKTMSEETRIPQARLVEDLIIKMIKEHEESK